MDDRWSRAKPGFRKTRKKTDSSDILILSYLHDQLGEIDGKALQKALEKIVGLNHLIRIDDLFAGESFVSSPVKLVKYLVVGVLSSKQTAVQWLLEKSEYAVGDQVTYSPTHPLNPEDKKFSLEISALILESGARLLQVDGQKNQ
jgi:hypothetical protein